MGIKLKEGVSVRGVRPETLVAMLVVDQVFAEYDVQPVVTSCTDGVHSERSKHYIGHAIDIRTSNLLAGAVQPIILELRKQLGSDFDVIGESTHIHIEYDPKGRP